MYLVLALFNSTVQYKERNPHKNNEKIEEDLNLLCKNKRISMEISMGGNDSTYI